MNVILNVLCCAVISCDVRYLHPRRILAQPRDHERHARRGGGIVAVASLRPWTDPNERAVVWHCLGGGAEIGGKQQRRVVRPVLSTDDSTTFYTGLKDAFVKLVMTPSPDRRGK